MIDILVSLFLATVIGIGASAYYGPENLWLHPWVEQTTWFVIAAGMLSAAARWAYSSVKRLTQSVALRVSRRTQGTHKTT